MRKTKPAFVYQFHISLNGIQPPIWRRVQLTDDQTLADLHNLIQDAFGWLDYHLHQFVIHHSIFSDPAWEEFDAEKMADESRTRIRDLDLKEGSRFEYTYDFGDDWKHTLIVEKIIPWDANFQTPVCTNGKRACPPEDVGGVWGYQAFITAMGNPKHKNHAAYAEWYGRQFDPDALDLEDIQGRITRRMAGAAPEWLSEWLNDQIAISRTLQKNIPADLDLVGFADNLELRKDSLSFLDYCGTHKVIGTASTGNLPRKAVEEITTRFIHPPKLNTSIGDQVYKFQSEIEIWPMMFIHLLCETGGLILGGPGKQWKPTPEGLEFARLSQTEQVWILFAIWWILFDWRNGCLHDVLAENEVIQFKVLVQAAFSEHPSIEPYSYPQFVDQVVRGMGWIPFAARSEFEQRILADDIEDLVIDPLVNFGLLSVKKMRTDSSSYGSARIVSFSVTQVGKLFLTTLKRALPA